MRVALGAGRPAVIRMVLREAFALVAAGMALGAFVLAFVARLITPMLHGVSTFDPLTLAAVAGTLALVTLVAAFFPAFKAATVDPVEALRC